MARCSAPTAGDQFSAAQASRAPPRRVVGHERVVRAEPLRPLPSGGREELRAEVRVPPVERREPQVARRRHLLERMQDVVDLAVLLRPRAQHVRRRGLERVEAVRVGLGEVVAGSPVAIHSATCRPMPPPCVTHTASHTQKPRTLAALTDDRAGVRREAEHAVQRARRVGRSHACRPAAAGSRAASASATSNSSRRERHQARLHRAPGRPDLRLRRRDRLVVIAADPVVVAAVPRVHRHVLVAQDRMRDLARVAGELRDRLGPHQLVLHGDERDRHAGQRADAGAPDAGAEQDALALDVAAIGEHGVDAALADVEPGDGDAPGERDARRPPHAAPSPRRGARPSRCRRSARDTSPGSSRDPAAGSARPSRPA